MSVREHLDRIESNHRAVMIGANIWTRSAVERRLLSIDVPALVTAIRAALDVHKRRVADNGRDWCDECQDGPWPCATVRAITTALDGAR